MKAIEAKRNLEKRYEKQNEYNKQKYDRVSLMLPAGERDKLRTIATERKQSLNAFILEAIEKHVNDIE